jgi:hypothetical protein
MSRIALCGILDRLQETGVKIAQVFVRSAVRAPSDYGVYGYRRPGKSGRSCGNDRPEPEYRKAFANPVPPRPQRRPS